PMGANVKGNEKAQRLSTLKWMLGFLALIAVMVIFGGLPFYLRGVPTASAPPTPLGGMVLMVLGIIVMSIGAGAYGLMLLTGCLTFNYRKPFFKSFKARLWVANLLVGLLLQ